MAMEDKEYDYVERECKKFKKTKIGKYIFKEINYLLFKFYLEGYKLASKSPITKREDKKDE